MKKGLTTTALLFFLLAAKAHEFWLIPQKFSYQTGNTVFLCFKVGEDFAGDNWNGNNAKANVLKAYSSNYTIDLKPAMTAVKGDSVRLDTLANAGNYTIAYNGTNSFITLEAAKFNAYLKEDGLANVLAWRKENGMDTAQGKEYYQRCAKTLIRVKSTLKNSGYLKASFISSSTYMPLDIVPLDNPYNFKQPTKMQFNIFFHGRPLKDGLVRLWHTLNGKLQTSTAVVNNGVIEVEIIPTGTWMVSLVKMEAYKQDATADWQSYWGSLTWGYN